MSSLPKLRDIVIGSVVAIPIFFFGTKLLKKIEREFKDRMDDDE